MLETRMPGGLTALFPINRYHQQVVTAIGLCFGTVPMMPEFPINRCHQQVVTQLIGLRLMGFALQGFPINRCHQQVVTAAPESAGAASDPKAVCVPPYLGGTWGGRQACGKR